MSPGVHRVKRRLVILTEIISPYRIPLFNALARSDSVEPHVIFLAENDPGLRQWRVYKDEIRFSYEVLPSRRMQLGSRSLLLNGGLASALRSARPDALLCGGYNYVASWQALLWAKHHGVPFLLWSESHQNELRRSRALVEFLKDEFLHRCSGFIVPGSAAREYLHVHRVHDEVIFTAPNAVDNNLFSTAAAEARKSASARRRELNLPDRYGLFVGRLVREKGVFELLAAYAKLDTRLREQFGLVFAGDGVCRKQLEEQSLSIAPGVVRFAGFVHREQLAVYYALAEILILPTYTDTWGLVVNEAMACGLPVILTNEAGCSADLVQENWNGYRVPSKDESSLAIAIEKLAKQPELSAKMGANSLQRISQYSAERWSDGIVQAVNAIGAVHD
jgi:glycosyltransferase involved in cell wall biosynthesis